MQIPRLTVVTLGVADLAKATAFYRQVLATAPNTDNDGVTFIQLPGTWISLFPIEHLAKDISPEVSATRSGFSGFTLACNVPDKEAVTATLERAEAAGGKIVKPAQDTFWGGFSGYFTDPDHYYWEVVWGPMFEFSDTGELRFKADS